MILKNILLTIKYPFLKTDSWYRYTWQDSIPSGWQKLSMQMWEEIKTELKYLKSSNFKIYDIKEKYGHLDISANGPESVEKILQKYEYISERTCIYCGRPASYITTGWISPYCKECINGTRKQNAYKYYVDIDWYGYKTTK